MNNRHTTTPNRSKYLHELIAKFPNHGALTLAKAAYKEYPEWFLDLEAARSAVRGILGVHGNRMRAEFKSVSLRRPPRAAGEKIQLPPSKAEAWLPFDLKASKIAIMSDVHVPYHDATALEPTLARFKKFNPDCVLLNGDIADCYSISRWEKDPRKRNFISEIKDVRQFLRYVRQQFPKARILYKLGNHEERWHAYLYQKAPELVGLEVTTFESIVESNDIGVEIIQDQRIITAGKLPILHGHELPKGLTNPVSPARGAFLRTIDCVLIGHHHRTTEHTEPSMMGKIITTWITGCLCDMRPEYARINRWNHGAAEVELAPSGDFHVRNFRIHDGKIL